MQLRIQAFHRSEQGAARALISAGLRERFPDWDETKNEDLPDIYASYPGRGHVFLVAYLDGRLIGAGGLVVGDGAGQIVRVSVHAAFRNRGIARRIVEALVDEAGLRGLAIVWMETNEDWWAAIALYKSAGFQEFDRRDGCLFMRRELSMQPRPGGLRIHD